FAPQNPLAAARQELNVIGHIFFRAKLIVRGPVLLQAADKELPAALRVKPAPRCRRSRLIGVRHVIREDVSRARVPVRARADPVFAPLPVRASALPAAARRALR